MYFRVILLKSAASSEGHSSDNIIMIPCMYTYMLAYLHITDKCTYVYHSEILEEMSFNQKRVWVLFESRRGKTQIKAYIHKSTDIRADWT